MQNLVDILSLHAMRHPDKTAFIMLDDSGAESDRLTYGALNRDARSIATSLRALTRPAERVLILYGSNLGFIRTFMGCQYADLVAVPTSLPSRHGKNHKRVEHIIKDADVSLIIADDKWATQIRSWLTDTPFDRLPIVSAQECLTGNASSWSRHNICGESISFIQYTSGSTGQPKGVMVRNRNIFHNSCLIRDAMGYDEDLIGGGWLPFYHDMGLIGLVLQPIFLGATAVMMAPMSFIKRPASWLKAITKYRIQASGGPNFGFEHCVSRIRDQDLSDVDLSSWRLCFSGAEPVRQATVERFLARFTRYGLPATSFYPCYGMAEATLFVAGGQPSQRYHTMDVDADRLKNNQIVTAGPTTSRRRTIVSCGVTTGFDVAIVHPRTRCRISSGRVGEVWLRGESIAAGYWGRLELTREIFGAVLQGEPDHVWFRTGDLGFINRDELFICGRLTDIIIVAGRNIYPHDIEAHVVALSPLLEDGSVVALGVDTAGTQSVAIVCEISRRTSQSGNRQDPCQSNS